MAAKSKKPLSFVDIVTGADAALIQQALEARVKIDELLVIREEAYQKIHEIENEIDAIVGEGESFDFGEAPYPVFGLNKKKAAPAVVKKAPAKKSAAEK